MGSCVLAKLNNGKDASEGIEVIGKASTGGNMFAGTVSKKLEAGTYAFMCKVRFDTRTPHNNEFGIQRYGPSDAEWEDCPEVTDKDFSDLNVRRMYSSEEGPQDDEPIDESHI